MSVTMTTLTHNSMKRLNLTALSQNQGQAGQVTLHLFQDSQSSCQARRLVNSFPLQSRKFLSEIKVFEC